MTDKQFVLKKYPNAKLDYKIWGYCGSNWTYRILTDNFFNPNCEIIAKAKDAKTAWSRAKKKILNDDRVHTNTEHSEV